MGAAEIIAIVAAAISAGSAIVALIQAKHAKAANAIVIPVEMVQHFRSEDFQKSFRFVTRDLWGKYPSGPVAISELDESDKDKVLDVAYFYNSLACLVYFKVNAPFLAYALLKTPAVTAWRALEPFILLERQKVYPLGYFKFFEDFAGRANRTPLSEVWEGLKDFTGNPVQ